MSSTAKISSKMMLEDAEAMTGGDEGWNVLSRDEGAGEVHAPIRDHENNGRGARAGIPVLSPKKSLARATKDKDMNGTHARQDVMSLITVHYIGYL